MTTNTMNHRSSNNNHSYQDVPSSDDDLEDTETDEFLHEEEDDEEVPHHGRKIRAPPTTRVPNNGMLCMLLYILVGLVLSSIALIGWKASERKSSKAGVLPEDDDEDLDLSVFQDGKNKKTKHVIHYDANVALHPINPFDLEESDSLHFIQPPLLPTYQNNDDDDEEEENDYSSLGYLQQPDIVNNTLVFVSEGDLYLSRISSKKEEQIPAMKLTTTVGNVLHPKINPIYPYYIAYTATYTGRREIYLLDLRKRNTPATRITYWDHEYGVSKVVQWKDDGLTLVFAAASTEIGLPDTRLYQLSLQQQNDNNNDRRLHHLPLRVWQTQPIPLHEATEGVFDYKNDKCLYFVRFAQSSHTIRYVGGTAESLWAWCFSHNKAVPLTTNYKGTDKSPSIVKVNKQTYLFFMSDRFKAGDDGEPASMNLWAMPLPTEEQLYSNATIAPTYIQLTHVSCDFDGMPLVEYAVDEVTGNVVLRIGADLHVIKAKVVKEKLSGGGDAGKKKETKKKEKKNDDGGDNRRLAKDISRLPIAVYSDFHEHQERLIPVTLPKDATTVDVYQTAFGGTSVLLGLRGQLFVTPVVDDLEKTHAYAGAGMNLPPRRYRVAPGIAAGGSVRIQAAKYVPLKLEKDARRLALVLATDPKSDTAEHAFYLLETQSDAPQTFVDVEKLPDPFLGGSLNGGSVADGGLGSVIEDSVTVSPCGRRFAWADRDGRICVMTMPMYQNDTKSYPLHVLPQENEQGQPLIGTETDLSWSPGGRYLAIRHDARNQFDIISIADCGSPDDGQDVMVGRIVQATSDRFNSAHMYWGKTALDFKLTKQQDVLSQLVGKPMKWPDGATVLYYLSDRDLVSDVASPFGTRQPSPHFPSRYNVYALPLVLDEKERSPLTSTRGTFGGGGASELWVDNILELQAFLDSAATAEKEKKSTRHLLEAAEEKKETKKTAATKAALDTSGPTSEKKEDATKGSTATPTTEVADPSPFPQDREIDFGDKDESPQDLSFARRAYRVGNIPEGSYSALFQPVDDPSIGVIEKAADKSVVKIFSVSDFPSDTMEALTVELPDHQLAAFSFSTTREYLVLFFAPDERVKIVSNSAAGLVALIQDAKVTKNIADTNELALSVWPALEYQQMYDDAWRLLRDYFYDRNMHGVDWKAIHARYRPLVKRCAKREELDDVLKQMAAELSALHVFVYGGEYRSPLHGDKVLGFVHETASLGATLMRSAEWKGYVVTSIPECDPDFNLVDGKPRYSPLSNQTLELTGQRGLQVGDVIVAVNGESVMRVPDIHMLLRGTKGRSVRLEVLRLASGASENTRIDLNLDRNTTGHRQLAKASKKTNTTAASTSNVALETEALITVPISLNDASELRYSAWEYKTRKMAKQLAQDAGFSVGYIHLRSMSGPEDIDAFYRNFYPDYNKEALIVDVRHNRGGNIDSWLLNVLQRQAWMFWQSRTKNITNGGLGWDEHFAFRGHIVVLVDEHTASDGEGFSRGVSELGLGKLIGKRTWGGGIWLSSDNHLVDGGIATAPEVGTYNDKFGWGLGIEQVGVEPDFEVDNDPRVFYDGKDQQLEYACDFLKKWIKKEPIVMPKNPGPHPDRSIPKQAVEDCPAR